MRRGIITVTTTTTYTFDLDAVEDAYYEDASTEGRLQTEAEMAVKNPKLFAAAVQAHSGTVDTSISVTTATPGRHEAHYIRELRVWGVLDTHTGRISHAPCTELWARDMAADMNISREVRF